MDQNLERVTEYIITNLDFQNTNSPDSTVNPKNQLS